MCIQDVYNDSQGASQTQNSLFSNMLQRIHRGWVNKLIQVSKAYIQLCVCIYVCLYIYMYHFWNDFEVAVPPESARGNEKKAFLKNQERK